MSSIMREDWIECELGEICNFVGGGTPSKSNSEYWNGNIPWASIKDIKGNFLEKTQDFITEIGLKESASNLALENEIILATRINPGKPIISRIKTAINQDLKVVKHKAEIDTKFLFYNFKNLEKTVIKLSSGTTVLGINLNNLNTISTPLAPLPIQRAIVSKIEALFSDLDNGIASFKKAQEQLKIYRQAVLKKAFEGAFSITNEELRITGSITNEKLQITNDENQSNHTNQKNHNSDNLPKGWKWVKITEIADTFGGYAFKSGDFIETGKYQVLRMGNVRPGIIRYNESPVFLAEVSENILEKALLKINDLIITQTGTKGKRDYGFTTLINKDNLLLNQRIAGIRCGENCLPKFLLYFTWTDKFKNQFFENETGNVGQGNVGMKAVTNTLIDLPSLQEQTQIVQEIESRLSVTDNLEFVIRNSIEKAEALRQSILKKAFEGKLLSQAEIELCKAAADYEPASELLKKITNEKLRITNMKSNKKSKK